MTNQYYSYFYFDPVDDQCRYVGKGHGRRLYKHLIKSHNKKFGCWMNQLKDEGVQPVIVKIDMPSNEEAKQLEKFWIQYYGRQDKGLGPLFNHTDGGDDADGWINGVPQEVKDKISATLTGRTLTPEHIENAKKGTQKSYDEGKHIPWNAGLTKETSPSIASQAAKMIGSTPVNKGKKTPDEIVAKALASRIRNGTLRTAPNTAIHNQRIGAANKGRKRVYNADGSYHMTKPA
jgi:hypothetical protein